MSLLPLGNKTSRRVGARPNCGTVTKIASRTDHRPFAEGCQKRPGRQSTEVDLALGAQRQDHTATEPMTHDLRSKSAPTAPLGRQRNRRGGHRSRPSRIRRRGLCRRRQYLGLQGRSAGQRRHPGETGRPRSRRPGLAEIQQPHETIDWDNVDVMEGVETEPSSSEMAETPSPWQPVASRAWLVVAILVALVGFLAVAWAYCGRF